MANKRSSRICSESLLLVLVLLVRARGQENSNNGEFKHELPEGVELVDPKSLGLTDVDLSKFLGNVKVLGGGQVGDTKTQILTVGFQGDENINFNDFTIPGLTDGNKTGLPEKDKEIADMAFQKFKEFFQDPNRAKQFEEGNNNINLPFSLQKNNEPPKQRSQPPPQQNNVNLQNHQPHFRIPMIQKPYTTPRTPFNHPVTQQQQPQPHHRLHPPPPPPPPPPPQSHPPRQFNPNVAQTQNHQQQHVFNAQIKSQPPLEFGARIPVAPNNLQARPPPPPPPQQHQHQFQNHQQSQGQYEFQRQQQQQHHHRLTIQHQQQGQTFQRPPPQPQQQAPQQQHFQQQRGPPQIPQNPPPQTPRIRFPQEVQGQLHPPPGPPIQQPQFPPRGQSSPQSPPPNPSPPHVPHQPRPPLVQNFVVHSRPQHQHQQQNIVHHQPPPASREQGRIVRNQLLQLERNNLESNYDGPPKGLLPPPPPQSYQSSTNQVPVHSPSPPHFQNHQPPAAAATATSSVYIHRGPKGSNIQQTPFHPQFQAPTRFAKDFTPMPLQTTTSRPSSFEVTPSMKLIPLSTNENAITDPTRMLQLRLYQQQKAQASNTHQTQVVLPQNEVAPTHPPTTTPISITTSYPEINDHTQFSSSTQYDFSGSQQQPQQSFDQNNNQIIDNEIIYNNAPFPLKQQQQQQQQQQLHFLQDIPTHQQQLNHHHHLHQSNHKPTVFYTQDHRRPPRQGPPPHPPRFQFHVSHELGQGPRFQMNPDPKSILNTIRRKRGYRRLSNLFNRMFRWDRQ